MIMRILEPQIMPDIADVMCLLFVVIPDDTGEYALSPRTELLVPHLCFPRMTLLYSHFPPCRHPQLLRPGAFQRSLIIQLYTPIATSHIPHAAQIPSRPGPQPPSQSSSLPPIQPQHLGQRRLISRSSITPPHFFAATGSSARGNPILLQRPNPLAPFHPN